MVARDFLAPDTREQLYWASIRIADLGETTTVFGHARETDGSGRRPAAHLRRLTGASASQPRMTGAAGAVAFLDPVAIHGTRRHGAERRAHRSHAQHHYVRRSRATRHRRSALRSRSTSPLGSAPMAARMRSRSRRPSRRIDFNAAGRTSIRHPPGSASLQLRVGLATPASCPTTRSKRGQSAGLRRRLVAVGEDRLPRLLGRPAAHDLLDQLTIVYEVMSTAGIAELKSRLSAYLARVRAGEEVVVTDRGRPIARLVPVRAPGSEMESELRDLARAGVVRIGSGAIPPEFWSRERPGDPDNSVRAALLDERRSGR